MMVRDEISVGWALVLAIVVSMLAIVAFGWAPVL